MGGICVARRPRSAIWATVTGRRRKAAWASPLAAARTASCHGVAMDGLVGREVRQEDGDEAGVEVVAGLLVGGLQGQEEVGAPAGHQAERVGLGQRPERALVGGAGPHHVEPGRGGPEEVEPGGQARHGAMDGADRELILGQLDNEREDQVVRAGQVRRSGPGTRLDTPSPSRSDDDRRR